jgi:secernin
MGCDMVVAVAPATGMQQSLFAANCHRPRGDAPAVRRVAGRTFTAGEAVQTPFVQLPQARQTCAVLAVQAQGAWGYLHGVNDRRVAAGVADWQSCLRQRRPGLLGPDLVRLVLERSHSAQQAVDVLTDLIARHGQGAFNGSPEEGAADHVFLLADPAEAFVVEAAGAAWAAQEIGQVRAAGDVAVIRQDWSRLCTGLADRAIAEGWWQADGTKLDFAGALSERPVGRDSALRRWGRATWLAEQQNGRIDGGFLRRLLADHYEEARCEADPLDGPAPVTPLCRHALPGASAATTASVVAQLPVDAALPAVYWVALGPPCLGVYFPLLPDTELPAAWSGALWLQARALVESLGLDRQRWLHARAALARLQARFDLDAEEDPADGMMQSHVERFEDVVQELTGAGAVVFS